VRATADPAVRRVRVDFANSLTWSRCPFDIPVERALLEVDEQPIPGFPGFGLPCFSPVFQFISNILHLFREAWFERWWDLEQDVNLMKFGDVLRLWRANQEALTSGELVQLLEEYDIVKPIVWALEHLDRTLHTGIVSALGLEGRVTDTWLSSAYSSASKLRRWKGTMRERLQCKNRRCLVIDDP
jgi:hypothetical protein